MTTKESNAGPSLRAIRATTRRKRDDRECAEDDGDESDDASTTSKERVPRKKKTKPSSSVDGHVTEEQVPVSDDDADEGDIDADEVDETEEKADTFKFTALFGKKLVFEHMSSTDLSTSIVDSSPTSHPKDHQDEQKELESLLKSTRVGDSLNILLKLNRSMSIIARMQTGPARKTRAAELRQSLNGCGYTRKNPGELGRAIIVARYISKRGELVKWLNKNPTANDVRPGPRVLESDEGRHVS